MGWKIAITGKGGVGKTTVAGVFAHLAASEGKRVLAVDADPDANLAAALGMPLDQRRAIIPLAERRALIEERTGAKVKQYGQIFKLNPEVSDIAEKESAEFRSIHLLVLGAIESGGSGCACPESVLLRALLTDIVLFRDDFVILDMEAGLEHLGRGTARGVDLMVVVVEPGKRAVETADSVKRMATEIGIVRFAVIGNKIADENDENFLRQSFSPEIYLGGIPYSEVIHRADREDLPLIDLMDGELRKRFEGIWAKVRG